MPHSIDPSTTPAATYTALDEKYTTSETDTTPVPRRIEENFPPSPLPYWLVNVPRSQWPAECPSFLRDLPAKSIGILSTPDEQYERQGWGLVREIIRTNRIDRFQRLPSDLRKYLEYTAQIKERYGSVMQFVVQERLRWDINDLEPKGRPFECEEDIKILYNDWPYGLEQEIVHLVIWTKFELEDDAATNDLTPRARKEIEDYVQKIFCSRMPAERVTWFKNWPQLRSIHSINHFHVVLLSPDTAFIEEITQGDIPLIAKV